MRLLAVLALFVGFVLPVLGQGQTAASRPPLPADYYEKFRLPLPPGLNLADSLQVAQTIRQAALAIDQLEAAALTRYRLDTTQLAAAYLSRACAALALGQLPEFMQYRRQTLRLQPGPSYLLPWALLLQGWAEARRQVPNEQDPKFRPALRLALRQQMDSLPALTRQDVLNTQKGAYAPSMTRLLGEAQRSTLQQAVKAGQLTYRPAGSVVLYGFFMHWMRHRATVEQLLYELNPARVAEEKVMVPMRDGVKLSALLYRNSASTARVPVIVLLSPYPGGSEARQGNIYATNGYVFLYVDTRGRRGSEGAFQPYEQDARDFYDIIDWASKQPWCDGQVATSGGSYLGFAQWQTIRQGYRHPALKAINPMVSVGFGVDFPAKSNIFYSYALQWANYVSGRELNTAAFYDLSAWQSRNWRWYKSRLPFHKLDSIAGLPNPYFQKWVSHPDFDGYWRSILPTAQDYAALDLPVLTTTGYYDDDQNGALYYYRQHQRYAPAAARAKHQLLIGPFDHAGAQWMPAAVQNGLPLERSAQVPLYKYVLQWFDWVLKGQERPAWMLDQVTYFETNAGRWRGASTLENMTHDTLRLYLTPRRVASRKRKGLLALHTTVPKKSQVIRYAHDVAQVLDSAFVFAQPRAYDDSLYMTSPHNLVFESEPLARAVTLSGALLPRLFMSLNVPDADFRVTVYEQTAAGKSLELASSCLRTRYRHGAEKPQLLTPGRVERIDFDGNYLYVKRLAAGSRLRFVLEIQNTPQFERNYGFGGVVAQEKATGPRLIEASLHTGRKYPSRIDVPLAESLADKRTSSR